VQPKIQGLVSSGSIADRQFVTAWLREWVTNIRFMRRAVPSTVVRRRRKFGGGFLFGKTETRLPVEGSFGNKFLLIYNHCGVIAAWSRKTLKKLQINFFRFCRKPPLAGKFSKFCSKRIHHNTDGRVVFKFHEIWLTRNQWNRALLTWRKTKFRLALQVLLLHGLCPKSARASPSECVQSAPDFIQVGSLSETEA